VATVLVVDDEFGIAELFDAVLTDEGHRVLTARDGRDGMEVLASERADLIFLDFRMPVMDGAAMLGALATDPNLRGTPIVMMSSIPAETVAEHCSGYVTIMRKPFMIIDVVDLTERLLGKGSSRAV